MAALFIHGADKIRYGCQKSTLAQNMLMGSNQYPRSMEGALNILNTYSQTTRYQKKGKPTKREDGQAGLHLHRQKRVVGIAEILKM